MSETMRRGLKQGLGIGLIAGMIFGVMEMVGAVIMGNPPLMPIRMFASTVLGHAALMETPAVTALLVGVFAHLALSAVFGVIYGVVNGAFSATTETRFGRQAAIGLLAGAMLWLVNFQIIARIAYPWFLGMPQGMQMLMHAMFFGLPLGLMYAGTQRHARHVGNVLAPT